MAEILDQLNHTELVSLARLNGIPGAAKSVPREVLIYALRNLEPIDLSSPTAGIADRMSKWLIRWWARLQDTAPKSCCPNCPGCPDLQILDCYEVNKGQIA